MHNSLYSCVKTQEMNTKPSKKTDLFYPQLISLHSKKRDREISLSAYSYSLENHDFSENSFFNNRELIIYSRGSIP